MKTLKGLKLSWVERWGVRALFLFVIGWILAISDGGKPCYCADVAKKLAREDIPCFACPPEKLPELLDCALKRRSLSKLAS